LDVPAQEVPAPAAQSFLPLSATPKHFSLSAPAAGMVCWAAAGATANAALKAATNATEGNEEEIGCLMGFLARSEQVRVIGVLSMTPMCISRPAAEILTART
jgi:hypothetical protein